MLPSSAAENIVPGNFGWGSLVLAAITKLAPSLAALRAIALPMPRLAPVMKIVFPANFLIKHKAKVLSLKKNEYRYGNDK